MPLSRDTDSTIRQLLEVLDLAESGSAEEVLKRLEHLRRALAPEHELTLIFSWLGRCRLVHRLSQEQLPLRSTEQYRVPDLLAVFDYGERAVPALIEVKTTADNDGGIRWSGALEIKPHLYRYAELLDLPLLVAWRNGPLWTLFEARHAELAVTNYRIDFKTAMKENLMGILAGDFGYRLVPGSAIRMFITRLGEADPETGGFEGVIRKVTFVNPSNEEFPDIPHLMSLFMLWEDEVVIEDNVDEVVQSFVIRDTQQMDFASLTFAKVVHVLADLAGNEVDWRRIVHDAGHLAHDGDRLRRLVDEGAKAGIVEPLAVQRPRTSPQFL